MDTKKKIDSLVQKLSTKGKFDIESEKSLSNITEITGLLLGKDKNDLVLKVGKLIFHIPIEDIVEIVETNSKAFNDEDNVEVKVSVNHDALVKVVTLLTAKEIPSRYGIKPIVFDLPSQSGKFNIPINEFNKDFNEWISKTKLEDLVSSSDTPTLRLTAIPTGRRTGTQNNDTTIDYSTDYESDVD